MSTQAPNGVARASQWTRRSVPWLGALFIAIIAATAVIDVVRHYRETVAETARELETQSRIIAEHTARSAQAVDVVLRHIAAEFRRGRLSRLSPEELHAYLNEQAIGLVQIYGFSIHDVNGDALAISWRPPGTEVNVSGMDGFHALRDNPQHGLEVSPATRSPTDQQWIFPMGRRLETQIGQFAGVVGTRVRSEYFERFYADIRLDEGTITTLMHRNGTLLARHPPAESALGQHFPLLDAMIAVRTSGRPGPLSIVSPIDGVERFGALRSVPDYPLEVIVTRDKSAALAQWREQAFGTAARTVALAVLAALLLGALLRQIARLDAARTSLESNRERFALAVAGADDGIIDWDIRAGVVFASARARELLGMAPGPETTPAEDWFASVNLHDEDAPRRETAIQDHLAGRTPYFEGEYRVRHANGTFRWIRMRGLCTRDASGKPQRMAGSVSDIDARKHAEEALRQSEERFALAMTGSNEGHWVWDIQSDEIYVSRRLNAIFGLPRDITVTTRTEYAARMPLHPQDRESWRTGIDDHVAGKTPQLDMEYRIVMPESGEVRWAHARGLCFRDDSGKPLRLAGSTVDVTERKRIEEALRQSEQRYQLAIAGVNQGVWDWDLTGDTVFLSTRAQELFGLEPGESLRPRREWLTELNYQADDRVRVRRALSAYLRGETQGFEVEYRLRLPSGDWRWYHDRGVALRDEQGRPYRMAGSIEDITDHKQAEAERDRLEAQLRQAQKLEAMGTLAGGVAHDFNNILAAIVGYGEMAQKEAPQGTPLRRHIDAAMNAGLRAKTLVERILAFSRSGMGERVLVHVQTVVAEVLDVITASLPPGIRLERHLAAGDAAILGDPTQLHQVVMNLCTNAVQAIGSRGVVSVSIDTEQVDAPRLVTTCTLPASRYVRLKIADTGAGIDPKLLDRIFDPFFSTKEVGAGTGLGLSLVHGIVTDLGGGVEVETRLDAGSTFTVYIPWQGSVSPPKPVEEAFAPGCGETVLLVDDETTLVRLGEEMLAQLGYEPVGFTSSSAALKAFRAEPTRFDAVLSDEAMPGMTGSELAIEIRKIRRDIPILLMSGFASAALAVRARDASVCEVLAKPLSSRDIARSLAAALKR